jgi:hypothetical protein
MSDAGGEAAGKKNRKASMFNVRDALGSLDAIKKYDAYLVEHKRRLRQLEKEAAGDMCPSDDWYTE